MLSCPFDALDRIAGCLTLLTAVVLVAGVVWMARAVSDWLSVRRFRRCARVTR
ncbi:hypothetical protein LMG29542_04357 [Paraburkholderia humisilvae]|uniref:Uncharacterized protein n=1 Tax=Paraburkholderia humisilvae TaxID=627669 RepID=A0A6J5EAR1_9BURK|nr:hypothetical protein LMG29542_04357 [Paraburkholderia humisilvae]